MAVVAIAIATAGAKPRLRQPPDSLHWSADSQFVVAGVDEGEAVRYDRKGRPLGVPEGGLSEVRLTPEGRLVLGARESAFVSVDLQTSHVEQVPIGSAKGKPVVWMRGPHGDVIVTKAVAHYSIRRTGGRSSDADAAPTKNYRAMWVDPVDPLAFVDTGYGLELRHLHTGLTLRVFDSGRQGQRYVGAARDAQGRLILAVQDDEAFRMWTPPDPPGTGWDIDNDAPKALSSDGTRLAVGGAEGVTVYATHDRSTVFFKKARSTPHRVAFSPDDALLAVAHADGSVKLWPMDDASLPSPLARDDLGVDIGQISPAAFDQQHLPVRRAGGQFGLAGATAHLGWIPGGKLAAWVGGKLVEVDPTSGAERALRVSGSPGRPFAWSEDGTALAVVTPEGVSLYETRRWRVRQRLASGGNHNQLQWRGNVLTVDAGSGRAQSWDPTSGAPLGEVFLTSTEATARFTLSPDGQYLAVSGRLPRIVSAIDGALVARIDQQWAGVVAVAWSADGRRLATAGGDSTVLVWDTATWEATSLLEGAHGREIAFSPDGRQLVSASWDGAIVANVDTGTLEEALAFEGLLANVGWSPEGIVMVDNAGSLYVWPELP